VEKQIISYFAPVCTLNSSALIGGQLLQHDSQVAEILPSKRRTIKFIPAAS
jgi:hypothetical protein